MISDKILNTSRKSWYLKLVDTTGRPRYDVSPLWADSKAFSALVKDINEHFEGIEYNVVVALDALGFILGAAIASTSGKGLVPLRKGGKLPLPAEKLVPIKFQDYDETTKRFEVVKDLVKPGDRVLLVDEWVGTGAQIRAATQIIEQIEAVVAGIAVLYVFPDEPANLDIVRKYETFTANLQPLRMQMLTRLHKQLWHSPTLPSSCGPIAPAPKVFASVDLGEHDWQIIPPRTRSANDSSTLHETSFDGDIANVSTTWLYPTGKISLRDLLHRKPRRRHAMLTFVLVNVGGYLQLDVSGQFEYCFSGEFPAQ